MIQSQVIHILRRQNQPLSGNLLAASRTLRLHVILVLYLRQDFFILPQLPLERVIAAFCSSPLCLLAYTLVAFLDGQVGGIELLLIVSSGFSPRAAHGRLHRPLKGDLLNHLDHLLIHPLAASVVAVLLISRVLNQSGILLILASFRAAALEALLRMRGASSGARPLLLGLLPAGLPGRELGRTPLRTRARLVLSLELQRRFAVRIVRAHAAAVRLPAQKACRMIGIPELSCVRVGLRAVAVRAVHALAPLDSRKNFSLPCEPSSDGPLRSDLARGQLLPRRWRLRCWLRGPRLSIGMCRLQAFAWLTGAHL